MRQFTKLHDVNVFKKLGIIRCVIFYDDTHIRFQIIDFFIKFYNKYFIITFIMSAVKGKEKLEKKTPKLKALEYVKFLSCLKACIQLQSKEKIKHSKLIRKVVENHCFTQRKCERLQNSARSVENATTTHLKKCILKNH